MAPLGYLFYAGLPGESVVHPFFSDTVYNYAKWRIVKATIERSTSENSAKSSQSENNNNNTHTHTHTHTHTNTLLPKA